MGDDPLETVLRYHQETKHHPQRYARSLGYLDWATQPDPFRRYAGAELLPLPIPPLPPGPGYEDVFRPAAVPPAPLDLHGISLFLYASLAISAWKRAGASTWSLRVNPSSGNLHPTEGYLLLPPVDHLGDAPGLYHYAPRIHGLERRRSWPGRGWSGPAGSFLAGTSSIHWREAWKYGERAFRYCQLDLGHALAAFSFAAAGLGWTCRWLAPPDSAGIARVLALDAWPAGSPAEPEEPEALVVVTSRSPDGRAAEGFPADPAALPSDGPPMGVPNPLSPAHVDWPIIDAVAAATRKPATGDFFCKASDGSGGGESVSAGGSAGCPTVWQIIRQRRSAVAYDGRTAIGAAAFYDMLRRTLPGRTRPAPPPWDLFGWTPRIHLLLFVHRVEDLPPGLYVLVRDPAGEDRVRARFTRFPHWRPAPGRPADLPLYLLEEGDARAAARTLSLGQEIAADGAFSLGMLAELDRSLAEFGPWFYRNLYWEAGAIGQVLYLEAEARGIRGTGIGAFFDDLVHGLVGLRDTALQSLYHFTCGGAVEDPRITTLPAYPGPAGW